MKFLLTSSGISNPSISSALTDLLGKPISEASALFIPTGILPFPGGAGMAWKAMSGEAQSPLCGLGWKSLGVLELTALPSIRPENWIPAVEEADALLVWGGDVLYLCHWMRESGLVDLLPSLECVYVGVRNGRPPFRYRPTRSTIARLSPWWTALSRSCPKGTGSCSRPDSATRKDCAVPPSPRRHRRGAASGIELARNTNESAHS